MTKEQLRTKQFEENIKQVEFPQSVEALPKLKEWVIHYMKKRQMSTAHLNTTPLTILKANYKTSIYYPGGAEENTKVFS